MSSPTVFISYSHKDRKWVKDWLLPRLEENGLKVIIDFRDFQIGLPSLINMERAVERGSITLLVLTPNWVRSEWANFEALMLQSSDPIGLKGSIMPLMLRDCELPKRLSILTYANFKNPANWETEFSRLMSQITQKPAVAAEPAIDTTPLEDTKPEAPEKISLAKMPSTNPELFGREKELEILDKAWENPKTNILSLVAFGGVGKTALVNKWLYGVRDDNWRGAERVLGWSFYSQGAKEGKQVSADQFIAFALDWFGDDDPTKGSPWDKAERLADLVRNQRTLLILDGLEPLQNPPGPEEGRIKDPGLQCLLRELANHNSGLCVITTRLKVDDIKDFVGTSVEPINLDQLSPEAGTRLLQSLGAEGTPGELKKAADEFGRHALALTLLGRYVVVAYRGDIRQRDKIPKLIDEQKQGGHARRVMESYEKWFEGKPELDILYVMGLFDRPAEGGSIKALREKPTIEGLTSNLRDLSDIDWKYALKSLRDVRFLSSQDLNHPDTLDCHPLVREHFGEKLQKNNPAARKKAHSRLYEYYKSAAKEYPDTIEEMALLYAAVAHGCQAGRHQEMFYEVYWPRISRGDSFFSWKNLGTFGADLAALSGFFDVPWQQPVSILRDSVKGFVMGQVGYYLRTLGRLAEAAQPMEAGLKASETLENWANAARSDINLSELYLTMGNLGQALTYAQQGVEYADRSGDKFEQCSDRTTVADVLHQAGHLKEAEAAFREAKKIQKAWQPDYPLLYSLRGFQYCDLLLSQGKYSEVLNHAEETLAWVTEEGWLLDIALDHLSLGHAHLVKSQSERTENFSKAGAHLNEAVDGLRQAGYQDFLSRGLLARAELYPVHGEKAKAERDLSEAKTIATRSGMRLHEADCHLEYARLYLATGEKDKARENIKTAAKMIKEMEYHRRDPEVHLVYAQLYVVEGDQGKAREHLDMATKMIEDMGMHRWDKDAEDLEKVLA